MRGSAILTPQGCPKWGGPAPELVVAAPVAQLADVDAAAQPAPAAHLVPHVSVELLLGRGICKLFFRLGGYAQRAAAAAEPPCRGGRVTATEPPCWARRLEAGLRVVFGKAPGRAADPAAVVLLDLAAADVGVSPGEEGGEAAYPAAAEGGGNAGVCGVLQPEGVYLDGDAKPLPQRGRDVEDVLERAAGRSRRCRDGAGGRREVHGVWFFSHLRRVWARRDGSIQAARFTGRAVKQQFELNLWAPHTGPARAQMSAAEVVRVKIARHEITAAKVPELRELFGLERLPLAQARVEVELKGVPTAVVNALRRVLIDEMPGRALKVPPDGFNVELTTDSFTLPQFVNDRIACLRLPPQIAPDVVANLRLKLDVSNRDATPLTVYAGDFKVAEGAMPEPLFNPTTKLAFLQPGKRLVIEGVYISTGYGRDNGVYNVACRGAFTHLDLEQYSDAEMREEGGVAADWSGYKVSNLLADPRHHLLSATLPATTANLAETRAVFADACANIKERLRLIATTVERRAEAPSGGFAHRGVQYTVVELEAGLEEGILQVPGETHTIGELLCRAVFELTPEVANVAYIIVAHENRLSLSIRHTEDVTRILMRAIHHSIATFDAIQRGVAAAR